MKKMVIAMAMLVLLLGCSSQMQQVQQPQMQNVAVDIKLVNRDSETLYEKQITVQKGKSLFEAMIENSVPFEYKEFSFGVMVTSVAGVSPGSEEYIAIYKNGKYASAGVKDFKLDEDMNVEFRLEEIKPPA
ncbi:MAG TPA: DUF4430 domain-containing protein [archaeon]|nr:DUF4430 domain-containing protein [archaeon]